MFARLKALYARWHKAQPKEPELLIFAAGTDSYRPRTRYDVPALLQGPAFSHQNEVQMYQLDTATDIDR